MKDYGDIRRVGRGRRNCRVLRSHRQLLQELWSVDGGAMREPANRKAQANAVRQSRLDTNWRVKLISPTRVLALEPGRDYKNLFEGGDVPFWEAVMFAAAEIRKASDGQHCNTQSA